MHGISLQVHVFPTPLIGSANPLISPGGLGPRFKACWNKILPRGSKGFPQIYLPFIFIVNKSFQRQYALRKLSRWRHKSKQTWKNWRFSPIDFPQILTISQKLTDSLVRDCHVVSCSSPVLLPKWLSTKTWCWSSDHRATAVFIYIDFYRKLPQEI